METEITPGAAIVTGASRGLGLGIAQALARTGHPVVLAARGAEELERAAASIGHDTLAVPTDVADEDAVGRLVAAARERFGAIGAVVNNAGALPVLDPLETVSWDEWRRGIEVDVRGLFNTTRAVAPVMRAQRGGSIVTVAAAAGGTIASPLHLSVSPAQAALTSLSRCIGAWLEPAGVRVHTLHPRITPAGGVGLAAATAFGAEAGTSADEWVRRRFGEELLEPDTVGEAVVALLGEADGGDWSVGPDGLAPWMAATQP